MPNQTPTPHTLKNSQNQTPSPFGRGLGGGFSQQMKSIEISDKLRERVRKLREQLPEMGPRVQALVDEDKERKRLKELEKVKEDIGYTIEDKQLMQEWKLKYPDWYNKSFNKIFFGRDYIGIEIDIGLLEFDREDLNAEKLKFSFFDKIKYRFNEDGVIECNGHYYFTFNVAQREAKKLGKRLPSNEEWLKTVDFMPGDGILEKASNLIKILKLNKAGYYTGIFGKMPEKAIELAIYWTVSLKKDKLVPNIFIVNNIYIDEMFPESCLPIRCIKI